MRKISLQKNQWQGYLFILPIFVFFAVFCIYPIVFNAYYSLFDWNGMSAEKTFVSISNYSRLFTDSIFLKALRNTGIFLVFTIFPQAFIGLFFAYVINRKIKGASIFRTILYLPCIFTISITGTIFSKILETNRGDLNMFLKSIGLKVLCQQWLAQPNWAMFSLIMVNIWTWTGFSMLQYYASMTHISESLYESATIDGASKWKQFIHITFPLLKNTHASLIVMGTISTLKTFDLPYVLTKSGPNHATEFFSTYIYTLSFDYFDQGRSSALVMILFILALIFTVVQLRMYNMSGKNEMIS